MTATSALTLAMFVQVVQRQVCFDQGSPVSEFKWPSVEFGVEKALLICDLQCVGVNIYCIQETHLFASDYEGRGCAVKEVLPLLSTGNCAGGRVY